MALTDLIRGKGKKEKQEKEEEEEEEEEEEDDERTDYSFASIYTGPRPAFVPIAQTLTARKDAGKNGSSSSSIYSASLSRNGNNFSRNGSKSDPLIVLQNPRPIIRNQSDSVQGIPRTNSMNPEYSLGTSPERPLPLSHSSIAHSDCVPEQRTIPESSNASVGKDSRIHRGEEEEEEKGEDEGDRQGARGEEMAFHSPMQVTDALSSRDMETQRYEPSSSGQEDAISTPSSGRPSSSFRTSTDNASSPELKPPSFVNSKSLNHIPKKGECHECLNASWVREKETCLVCGAKICINCVLKVMGSMPEGRKCMGCVGQPIDESRRSKLGKPSRLLNRLLDSLEVHQIMKVERECISNQIRPEQIFVNERQLNAKELAELLGCKSMAFKLRPGRYWYDNQCGYWGKEGEKPDHIIRTGLNIGGSLQENASAGSTLVYINNRQITKPELKVLKFLNVQCPPLTRLWVDANGQYRGEGQNNPLGNIWEKTTSRFLYPLFSLPIPNQQSLVPKGASFDVPIILGQNKTYKILLLGFPGAGTSAIFKQVKFLYNVFSSVELHNLKLMIQRDIYKYITLLLEARERFEDEEKVRGCAGENDMSDEKNVFSLNEKLKAKADFFLDIMAKGEFDLFFPAATREYAPRVEEIWKDPAIQATYLRRSEFHMLPETAEYFLDKVVEISSPDYQLSEDDILYADGISDGLGFVEAEFSLAGRSFSRSRLLSTEEDEEQSLVEKTRYHLIRINGNGILDGVHKWLDMFEDIHAVVFCVGLDAYDQMSLATTNGVSQAHNKMMLTRELFEHILKYPCFRGKPVMLFLNKYDAFERKVFEIPITRCEWFSAFNPVPSSRSSAERLAQQAYEYIAHEFKKLYNMATGEKLFTFKVNAHQKSIVEDALWYVNSVMDWEETRKGGETADMVEDSTCTTEVR